MLSKEETFYMTLMQASCLRFAHRSMRKTHKCLSKPLKCLFLGERSQLETSVVPVGWQVCGAQVLGMGRVCGHQPGGGH